MDQRLYDATRGRGLPIRIDICVASSETLDSPLTLFSTDSAASVSLAASLDIEASTPIPLKAESMFGRN
jgi:hypothetical protein